MKKMIVIAVMLFVCAGLVQGQDPSLVGLWEFNDPNNLTKATIGPDLVLKNLDLVLVGTDSAVAGRKEGDGAVHIPRGSYYIVENPVDTTLSPGSFANEFTLVFDFHIPVDSLDMWRCFYQTDTTQAGYGECWVSGSGGLGVWNTGDYLPSPIVDGKWFRLVLVYNQEDSLYNYYLDGILFHEGFTEDVEEDGRFGLREKVIFFGTDPWDEDGPWDVSEIRVYNRALSTEDVLAMGGFSSTTGQWTFNDPDSLTMAKVGTPLDFVGTVNQVPGPFDGDIAAQADMGSHMVVTHGIAPSISDGTKVNEFTMIMDVMIPELGKKYILYQTDPTNQNDGDWVIKPTGEIGVDATGYTDAFKMNAGEWYRLAIVVKNGERYDYYADGELVLAGTAGAVDGQFSLESTLLLFADDNGEDNPVSVNEITIIKETLTSDDIANLGGFAHVTGGGLVGHWTFDNVLNQLEATVGNDLELVGNHLPAEGPAFGNLAVNIDVGSHYVCTHGIDTLASPGNNVNNYTVVWDFRHRAATNWCNYFQTDTTNSMDGMLFTSEGGNVWTRATETDSLVAHDTWYRLAISVYNPQRLDVYLDGELVLKAPAQGIDGLYSLDPKILFAADESGEDGSVDFAEIMLFSKYLTPQEIYDLGGVGNVPFTTDVADNPKVIRDYELEQNYPNPFNPTTNITFSIPKAKNVKIMIYNTRGQVVKTILDKTMAAGRHNIKWNGKNSDGNLVSSGIYFYKLETPDFVKIRRAILLK